MKRRDFDEFNFSKPSPKRLKTESDLKEPYSHYYSSTFTNMLDEALLNACFGGHDIIVNLLIERGASDWNGGLLGACSGGHASIAYLMIQKGATNIQQALQTAMFFGHSQITHDLNNVYRGNTCEFLYRNKSGNTFQ
ncbi:hypothetical protein AKO1_012844 [Acrasis kona]|uniref:Ankyrin repeat protein n=1 Tax=Acrasis kona TaxID=1008807 RepID=A0AAW2YVF8_9EUKA